MYLRYMIPLAAVCPEGVRIASNISSHAALCSSPACMVQAAKDLFGGVCVVGQSVSCVALTLAKALQIQSWQLLFGSQSMMMCIRHYNSS